MARVAVPLQSATTSWKKLNGLLCVFKPANITLGRLVANLKLIIPQALNRMVQREPRKIVRYDASLGIPMETVETDYSDHPLVIGPRYDWSDIRCCCNSALAFYASGVCLVGLNRDRYMAEDLENSKPIRVYHMKGQLGIGTDNFMKGGRVIERASYSRVFRPVIDKVVAGMQAAHQRSMYLNVGVPLQSQEAYDLATQGLLRPTNDRVPILYGIKCVSFEKPFFTIEVTCVNENEEYLLNLIHVIGLKCRTVARCTSIKCVRYGPFTLEHALLQHSWKVENFVTNIQMCNAINEEDIKSGRRMTLSVVPLAPNNKEESVDGVSSSHVT